MEKKEKIVIKGLVNLGLFHILTYFSYNVKKYFSSFIIQTKKKGKKWQLQPEN